MLTILRRNQIRTPANAHTVTPPSDLPQLEQLEVITLPKPSVNAAEPKLPLNVTRHEQKSTAPTSVLDPKLASHVDSLASHAAQHPQTSVDMVPSTNGPEPNSPTSDAARDLELFTIATSGSDVDPPLFNATQHPQQSTSAMPSADAIHPKPPSPDTTQDLQHSTDATSGVNTVVSTAQSDASIDVSTLSTAEADGNGSSVNPITESLPPMPGSLVSSLRSNHSPPGKKKGSGVLRPGPANTAR